MNSLFTLNHTDVQIHGKVKAEALQKGKKIRITGYIYWRKTEKVFKIQYPKLKNTIYYGNVLWCILLQWSIKHYFTCFLTCIQIPDFYYFLLIVTCYEACYCDSFIIRKLPLISNVLHVLFIFYCFGVKYFIEKIWNLQKKIKIFNIIFL